METRGSSSVYETVDVQTEEQNFIDALRDTVKEGRDTRLSLNVLCVRNVHKTLLTDSIKNNDNLVFCERINGRLTIWGFMWLIRHGESTHAKALTPQNRPRGLNDVEILVMNNICTSVYYSFVQHIEYYLMRDESTQTDRNEFTSSTSINDMTQSFLRYFNALYFILSHHASIVEKVGLLTDRFCKDYESVRDIDLPQLSTDIDAKRFRYLLRPRPQRCLERLFDTLTHVDRRAVVVQPRFAGMFVVIHTHGDQSRCYNRYGDLLINFLYTVRFNKSATFEAVIVPLDGNGHVRNWRYWPFKKSIAIYITDVFRYEQNMLVHQPYGERRKRIESLSIVPNKSGNVRLIRDNRQIETPAEYWSTIESDYYTHHLDVLDPINGIIVRHVNDSIHDAPVEYRFNMKAYYDFQSDSLFSVHGDIGINDGRNIIFDLNMADYRTTCIVYAHDDSHFYICSYERSSIFQFYHAATLPRLVRSNSLRDPVYKPENLYVLGARVPPMGLCYLRTYYDKQDNIVGYDYKLTTSMYDVPYEYEFLNKLQTGK